MNQTNVELIKVISRIMEICSPDADHLYSTLANLDDTVALKRVLAESSNNRFFELEFRFRLSRSGCEFNLDSLNQYKVVEEKKKREIPVLTKLLGF